MASRKGSRIAAAQARSREAARKKARSTPLAGSASGPGPQARGTQPPVVPALAVKPGTNRSGGQAAPVPPQATMAPAAETGAGPTAVAVAPATPVPTTAPARTAVRRAAPAQGIGAPPGAVRRELVRIGIVTTVVAFVLVALKVATDLGA